MMSSKWPSAFLRACQRLHVEQQKSKLASRNGGEERLLEVARLELPVRHERAVRLKVRVAHSDVLLVLGLPAALDEGWGRSGRGNVCEILGFEISYGLQGK